jgi:phospholipid N-methyltransferase
MNSDWLFTKEGFSKFKLNGSFLPSSKFLAKQMIKPIKMRKGVCIVELGAGTGSLTKILAQKLPADGTLFVFELNPIFVKLLRETFKKDGRVRIFEENAEHFGKVVKKHGFKEADYVVSGLPLAIIAPASRARILQEIKKNLSRDGLYIQFQYFLSNWLEIRKHFNSRINGYEIRNFPPAFLYVSSQKKFVE